MLIGGRGGIGAPPPKPVKVRLSPTPRTNLSTGANPRGVAIAQRPPRPTAGDTQARTLTTGANPRGTAITQRAAPKTYEQTPGYQKAVLNVFKAQSPAQQKAIVQGAIRNPTPEGRLILGYIKRIGVGPSGVVNLAAITPAVTQGMVGGIVRATAGLPSGVLKVVRNAAKDVVDLPGGALTSVYDIGKNVATGHEGTALNEFIGPYKQFLNDPWGTFKNHPLDTALLVGSTVAPFARVAGGAVRLAAPDTALGHALDTTREGVALTGNLTRERPRYSPYPHIQAGQKLVEKTRYKRAPTGELVPRSRALHDRLMAQETSRLVGVNERIRRVNRGDAQAQRETAVTAPLAARAAHAARTALKYGPQRKVIPGAGVLARIADGTIRRPGTIVEDLQKHLDQVAANRPNLLEDPAALKAHDQYVKQVRAALNDKAFLKNPRPAFRAAEQYAKDYAPVEAAAAKLGHFGPTDLQRRAVLHYAVTHMGAKLDATGKLLDAEGQPLSVDTVLAHINGKNGTGGRRLAYTPDRVNVNPDRSYYVSGERRPLPATAHNTLYAYTHGLTNPSHESLTQQHVLMRGIVDAHQAQNRMLQTLTVRKPDGSFWKDYQTAKRDAPPGYTPINVAQVFHPQKPLEQAMQGVEPELVDTEAARHMLDLSARLEPGGEGGRWALIHNTALKQINEHRSLISPNVALRTMRGLNTQFRRVALGTSAKHIPGVFQENMIRDVASGVGLSSWITGRRLLSKMQEVAPEEARSARIQMTGGQLSGATMALATRQTAEHFRGTSLYPVVKGIESALKTPGLRQLSGAWRAWTRFAIQGTKHVLEEQHQIAGLGKSTLRDFGSEHGPFLKSMRLQGSVLDDMARGALDPAKLRQLQAEIRDMYGSWTDLSPHAQTVLMFSPFGMWWTNSVKWLLLRPARNPIGSGAVAAAAMATQKERQAQGLDMFAPGALPLYEQGGIPAGGKIIAQNYYSPFGVVNNPLETGASLVEPWLGQVLLGSYGLNYLAKPLTSPANPKGHKTANVGQRGQYLLNSILATFVPVYSKAEQIAQGGSSAFDSSALWNVQTKTPGQGPVAGAKKAFLPIREYNRATSSSGGGGWGESSSSSSSGWGGSTGATGGWGG